MDEPTMWVKMHYNWKEVPVGTPIGMDVNSARSLVTHRGLGEYCEEPEKGELRARFFNDTGRIIINRGRRPGRPAKEEENKPGEQKEKKKEDEVLTVADMAGKTTIKKKQPLTN